jgi:hypothetical protein
VPSFRNIASCTFQAKIGMRNLGLCYVIGLAVLLTGSFGQEIVQPSQIATCSSSSKDGPCVKVTADKETRFPLT